MLVNEDASYSGASTSKLQLLRLRRRQIRFTSEYLGILLIQEPWVYKAKSEASKRRQSRVPNTGPGHYASKG